MSFLKLCSYKHKYQGFVSYLKEYSVTSEHVYLGISCKMQK